MGELNKRILINTMITFMIIIMGIVGYNTGADYSALIGLYLLGSLFLLKTARLLGIREHRMNLRLKHNRQ